MNNETRKTLLSSFHTFLIHPTFYTYIRGRAHRGHVLGWMIFKCIARN